MATAPGLLAAERKEACEASNVKDIDKAVGRVGGDVLADRPRRYGDSKVSRHQRDVEDVGVRIVVEVGGPGVSPALEERVSAHRVLDCCTEAIAVGIVGSDGP